MAQPPSAVPPGANQSNRGLRTVLAALLLLAACSEPDPTPAQKAAATPTPTPFAAAQNLLAFDKGAVVIDRTGEMALSSSPIYAIDPVDHTAWITPPKDPDHTVTIALPARSRVDKVGVSTAQLPGGTRPPKRVLFEGSADGSTFTALSEIDSSARKADQLTPIAPAELTHIRATIADGSTDVVAIGSLLAGGSEVAAFNRASIAGMWDVNGLEARFGQSGARVWGEIPMTPPMRIEGGWSGRAIRFIYLRGKEYGFGTIVVSPDGRSLNARLWYEEVIPLFEAAPQFGSRRGDAPAPASWSVEDGWMSRFKRVPVYGIEFDAAGNVDLTASAAALDWLAAQKNLTSVIKREYSADTPERNLELSRRQIESLKAALAARGVDTARVRLEALGTTQYKEAPASAVERPLFSRVEAVTE